MVSHLCDGISTYVVTRYLC